MKKLYVREDRSRSCCGGKKASAAQVVASCLYTGRHRLDCSNKLERQGHKKGTPVLATSLLAA